MSCHAMPSCHAGTLGAGPPARGAARSTAVAPHLQNSEFYRAAAVPGRAERPLQHSNGLVGTSVSFVVGHRWQQHSGTAAAALPVAAEPDTAVSDAGVSDSGAAGVTADEPVPAAEQSSASVEPEAAAADAAAQAEQLAAKADAATGQAASADADAASPAASEGDTTETTRAAAAAVREAAARPKPSAHGRKQHPKEKHKVVQRKPPQRRQQEQEHNVHEPAGPVEPVPQEDRWFRAGDVVPCKVEWSNARGARVSTLRDPRIIGYMPAKEGPYHVRTEDELHDTPPHQKQEGWAAPILPAGFVREFQVLKVPQDMEYNGRGPLLSARLVDLDTLWARAEQALRACRHGKETMRVRFLELNEGGLMARFLGLRLFMPLSHLAREQPGKFVPAEELEQKYLQGTLTEVAITEVDAFNRRFVCSENLGLENAAIRRLQTGSLVWGTVRRIEDFGAFVGFDDTRASGLIHISNISRQHVEYTEEVFKLGDRVRAVVLSAEDDYTRFSLSTAELEERPGDMLRDREKVYENAEEQVKIFLELQAEAAAEDAAYGATDAPRDSEILASGHY